MTYDDFIRMIKVKDNSEFDQKTQTADKISEILDTFQFIVIH